MIREHGDFEDITPHLHHRGGVQARHKPDALTTLMAIAKAEGLAPATRIHVCSGLMMTMVRERGHDDPEMIAVAEGTSEIPIFVDDTIPFFPGFEVHREVWTE